MVKPSKRKLARKAAYIGSLGASLDEIRFKPLETPIKVRAGDSARRPGRAEIDRSRRQD